MPLTKRRVPLRVTLQNLGFPRREMWQTPGRYLRPRAPFVYDSRHGWPPEVQKAYYEYGSAVDAGKLEFTHAYEKAFRHKNRFLWRNKAWKNPVTDFGAQLADKETRLREEFEAYKNRVMGTLEVKTQEDFGGAGSPRTVA